MSEAETKRIVILGGGFGGVYTARRLEQLLPGDASVQITLVSRDNYFLMTPLLFEAGSGILEPRHAVHPIRTLLDRTRFIEAEVRGVDPERRAVTIRPGGGENRELSYDHLVLALGGVTNLSIIPGSEHALTFKTLGDAIWLRNHIIRLFERADVETDPAVKRAQLTFAIVGAGLVGVELIGEVTVFLKNLARNYRHIDPSEIRCELIEGGPRIAPEFDDTLADWSAGVLRRRGVHIRTGVHVRRIASDRLELSDGQTIESFTTVLATGVSPSPLVAALPIERDHKGRAVTDPTMRLRGRSDLWALGDCASIPDPSGKPYPALAQHALREARTLAENLVAALRGGTPRPFVYASKGTLAALGHFKGAGRIGKIRVHGFVAWWIWRTYYLLRMPGWSRRIRIVIDWTVALFFRNDIVQLDPLRSEALAEPRPSARDGQPSAHGQLSAASEPVKATGE